MGEYITSKEKSQIKLEETMLSNLTDRLKETNKSVADILWFDKNVDKLFNYIKKIDEKIANWQNMCNSMEYNLFNHIYWQLCDSDIAKLNDIIITKFWNIYDEYRKRYYEEKIFNNIRKNIKFNVDIRNYFRNYFSLVQDPIFTDLKRIVKSSEEKDILEKYIEKSYSL